MQFAGCPTSEAEGYPPPPKNPKHPLLAKYTFEQLQLNGLVEAKPHVLHFGGFQIHKEHTQVLRILNTSASSVRVSIIGPSTQWFSIDVDKKGLLAPGMSENITVRFVPHQWRYYYDAVKVYCGEAAENLVVPVHAYPSANSLELPRLLDFGRVAMGAIKSKMIPMSCKIPIEFEYDVTVLESHPDFQVLPLSGTIPPDGTAEVTVTYTPSRHRTSRIELLFNISQFDFEPVNVSVVGCCLPDMSRNEVLEGTRSERQVEAARRHIEHVDAKVKKLKLKQGRDPIDVKQPDFPTDETERTVDGVKLYTHRTDPQAMAFVLNQKAGKLPFKDLFTFIKDQRREIQDLQKEAAQAKNSDSGMTDVTLEVNAKDRQAVELRFEMNYRDTEKLDREKELKSTVAVGETEPTTAEVEELLQQREARQAVLLERRMTADIGRVDASLGQGMLCVPTTYKPATLPIWDENANDTFSVRLQVIDRFLRGVAKLLMQLRAARRLRRLKTALRAAAVTDRASCRAWVEEETKSAKAGTKAAAKDTPAQNAKGNSGLDALAQEDAVAKVLDLVRFSEDFVLPLAMPTSQPGMSSEDREPIEVEPVGNFESFPEARINERLDYKVYDYPSFTQPAAAAHMRPHTNAGRRFGALEEESARGPLGVKDDGAEVPLEMPQSCLLPPHHDAMSLLVPSGDCRTYIAIPDYTECDPEYRLSQAPEPLNASETMELLPENIMSLETPWFATHRYRRRIADPFQYLDPVPPSFAEAGGSFCHPPGCCTTGEILNFLPVGGHERDLPSDTEDDECSDLQLPPPSQECFEATMKDLNRPLKSDRWQKERTHEERLRKLCDDRNCATRNRLVELNGNLSFRNKVYLA